MLILFFAIMQGNICNKWNEQLPVCNLLLHQYWELSVLVWGIGFATVSNVS